MLRCSSANALATGRPHTASGQRGPLRAPCPDLRMGRGRGPGVLAAAGGIITTPDGADLAYGRTSDFYVLGFVTWGDPSAATAILAAK